jgi:hypothetical protein
MDASADQTEAQRHGERSVRRSALGPRLQVEPDKREYQPMSTEAIMTYAPEQNRVQNKAGATQYLDQRVW